MLSALRRAFSLRANWSHLTTPSPGALHPIDGLRALSVLWVFLFHFWWFLGFFLPPDAARRLASHPALRLAWCGDLGVDCFFTISGFLIADLLMAQHDATNRLRAGRFYARRALRILPAYFTVLFVYCQLKLPDCDWAWANVLHISNFIPVEDQCMVWSWSLAVEEQFYAVIPLILIALYALAPSRRVWLLGGLVAAALAVSVGLVIVNGFTLPMPMLASLDRTGVTRLFDAIYDKPYARCTPLLIGVLAAFLRRHTRLSDELAKRARLADIGLMGALLAIAFVCLYPSRDPSLSPVSRLFSVFYIATFRPLFSAAIGYLLLLGLSTHPAGRALGAMLSRRFWLPIAQLSYSIYLLHPICIIILFSMVKPSALPAPGALLGYGLMALALSFAGALVVYLCVERPFMSFRPGASAPVPSNTARGAS